MQEFPNKQTIERLRKTYPAGTRVELVSMNDPYTKLMPGEQGTVQFIDDIGTIFVNWDCGSGLGVAYGEDIIRKIQGYTHSHASPKWAGNSIVKSIAH